MSVTDDAVLSYTHKNDKPREIAVYNKLKKIGILDNWAGADAARAIFITSTTITIAAVAAWFIHDATNSTTLTTATVAIPTTLTITAVIYVRTKLKARTKLYVHSRTRLNHLALGAADVKDTTVLAAIPALRERLLRLDTALRALIKEEHRIRRQYPQALAWTNTTTGVTKPTTPTGQLTLPENCVWANKAAHNAAKYAVGGLIEGYKQTYGAYHTWCEEIDLYDEALTIQKNLQDTRRAALLSKVKWAPVETALSKLPPPKATEVLVNKAAAHLKQTRELTNTSNKLP